MLFVYKYPLEPMRGPARLLDLVLPRGARILKIAAQGSSTTAQAWVLVEEDAVDSGEVEVRRWLVAGTGHPIRDEDMNALRDFGIERQESVLLLDGQLVFHYWISRPVPE